MLAQRGRWRAAHGRPRSVISAVMKFTVLDVRWSVTLMPMPAELPENSTPTSLVAAATSRGMATDANTVKQSSNRAPTRRSVIGYGVTRLLR